MRRLVVVGLFAALALSCGSLFRGMSVPGLGYVGVPSAPGAEELFQGLVEMEARCAQLGQQEVTVSEETNLGGAVALNWASRGGGLFIDTVDKPASKSDLARTRNAVNVYVATVGKNLATQSQRPALDWAFGVIDSEVFNAYSAPGGYVMVSRGLLQKVQNEAQLAGVLAHEIAHITQKHGLKAYQKVRGDSCRASIASDKVNQSMSALTRSFQPAGAMAGIDLSKNVALLGQLADATVKALLEQGFDEAQELEADRLAAEMVARAGYNPFEFVAFLDQIPEGAENFGKHPAKRKRQEKLRAYLAELEKDELLAANGRSLAEYAKVPLKDQLAAVR